MFILNCLCFLFFGGMQVLIWNYGCNWCSNIHACDLAEPLLCVCVRLAPGETAYVADAGTSPFIPWLRRYIYAALGMRSGCICKSARIPIEKLFFCVRCQTVKNTIHWGLGIQQHLPLRQPKLTLRIEEPIYANT
jgi:hypothetical protein